MLETALGDRVPLLQRVVVRILEPLTKSQLDDAVTAMLQPAVQHLQKCNIRVLSSDVMLSPVEPVAQMCNVQFPESIARRMRDFAENAKWTGLKKQVTWLDEACTMISAIACVEEVMASIRIAWQATESHTAISFRVCEAAGDLNNLWKSWKMFTQTSTDVFAPADGIFSEVSTNQVKAIVGDSALLIQTIAYNHERLTLELSSMLDSSLDVLLGELTLMYPDWKGQEDNILDDDTLVQRLINNKHFSQIGDKIVVIESFVEKL